VNAIRGRGYPEHGGTMLRIELDRLKHKDVRQRRRAVRRLFDIDDAKALVGFIPLLDDSDSWFREKAIEAFRRWISADDKNFVVTLTVHNDVTMRLLAAEIAPRLGVSSLAILETLCHDDDITVCRASWRSRLQIDIGSIPAAIDEDDYAIRRMAVERSGDLKLFEKTLNDSHIRVREATIKRMEMLSMSVESLNVIPDGAEISAAAANLCLPSLIDSNDTSTIAKLCKSPDAEMRNVLAKRLKSTEWFNWPDVVASIQSSEDNLLLPRLLRSRQEPAVDSLRLTILNSSDSLAKTRVIEDLHGRIVSEEVLAAVTSLQESNEVIISQIAMSLCNDQSVLRGD